MSAGGRVNYVWEKFGCNDHDLFIFVFSEYETTEKLINSYKTKGAMVTPKFPIVDKTGGASQLSNLFKTLFGSYGMGRSVLIRPDKSWKRISSYSNQTYFTNDFLNEGCSFNECYSTDIDEQKSLNKQNVKSSIKLFQNNTVQVNLPHSGNYFVYAYTISGKKILSQIFNGKKGKNTVPLKLSEKSKGIYFLKISSLNFEISYRVNPN